MFNWTRLIAIAAGALVALNFFSAAAFHYPPVARLCALRLAGADLSGASLEGLNLAWADLRGANLGGALLNDTDLRGADLRGAVGLTREKLALARLDARTALPYGMRPEDLFGGGALDYDLTQTVIGLNFVPNKVAVSPDGSVVAVVGETQEVRLWRVTESETGVEELPPLSGLGGHGRSVCFHPSDARVVAAGSDDGSVRLWRVGEAAAFKTTGVVGEGYVFNVKFDVGGGMLGYASRNEGSGQKTVNHHSVEVARDVSPTIGVAITPMPLGPDRLVVDFSPERRELAVAMAPQTGGQEAAPLEPNVWWRVRQAKGEVTVGAYSRDGRFLALGTRQGGDEELAGGSVSIWKTDEDRLLAGPPPVPDSYAVSLDFSSDGRLLACGWSDGSISLWDVEKAERVLAFGGHAGEVSNLAFAPDWRTLASVGTDKTLRLWRVVVR